MRENLGALTGPKGFDEPAQSLASYVTETLAVDPYRGRFSLRNHDT